MVDKKEILKWGKKYDKDQGWWVQKENELGTKFRKLKILTRDDLIQIVEWKFKDVSEEKRKRITEAVIKNDESMIERISSQVFNIPGNEDAYRVNSLTMLNGVSPVLASVILAFFDPKQYGVFARYANCERLTVDFKPCRHILIKGKILCLCERNGVSRCQLFGCNGTIEKNF